MTLGAAQQTTMFSAVFRVCIGRTKTKQTDLTSGSWGMCVCEGGWGVGGGSGVIVDSRMSKKLIIIAYVAALNENAW